MIDLANLYRGDKVRIVRNKRGRRLPPRVAFVQQVADRPFPNGDQVYLHFNRPASNRWVRPDQIEFVAAGFGHLPHETVPVYQTIYTEEERQAHAEAEEARTSPGSQASGGHRRRGG